MKYLKWVVGIMAGGALGFSYWHFIGCDANSCAITSSPINSTLYGGLMGVLLVSTFSGNRKKSSDENAA